MDNYTRACNSFITLSLRTYTYTCVRSSIYSRFINDMDIRRTQQFRSATFWRDRENCWEGKGFLRMKCNARWALSTERTSIRFRCVSPWTCRRNKLAIRKEERSKRRKQKDRKRGGNTVCPRNMDGRWSSLLQLTSISPLLSQASILECKDFPTFN